MHCPCHTFNPNGDIIDNENEVLEVKFEGGCGQVTLLFTLFGKFQLEKNCKRYCLKKTKTKSFTYLFSVASLTELIVDQTYFEPLKNF